MKLRYYSRTLPAVTLLIAIGNVSAARAQAPNPSLSTTPPGIGVKAPPPSGNISNRGIHTLIPGAWAVRAPFVAAVYGPATTSDGTYTYAAGGYSTSDNTDSNKFARYDPGANTWTSLAPIPMPVSMATAVYAPTVNKIYVFGGEAISSTTVYNLTQVYDIVANTWSTATPMPDVRAFMTGGYSNGKVYLAGGYSTGVVTDSKATLWIYTVSTDSWSSGTDMPHALGGAAGGVINGHLYVAGGRDASNAVLNSLYDYNITANTWATKATLPSAENVPGGAASGGLLYIFGGGNPFTPTSATEIYDPMADSWSNGPNLNVARSFIGGSAIGTLVAATAGYDGSTSVATNETLGVLSDLTVSPPTSPVPTFTEGQSQTVIVARFSDPDGNTPGPDYTATITWGDGTTDSCLVTASGMTPACTYGGGGSPGTIQFVNCNPSYCDVQATHTYKEETENVGPGSPAPYTITTTITDTDQTTQPASVTTTATVNDAALQGTGGNNGATDGSYSYPGASGCAIFNPCTSRVIATFTDANTFCNSESANGVAPYEAIGADGSPHYIITVSYGAGASPASGNFTVVQRGTTCVFDISSSTTYQTPGVKTLTVSITDEGCDDGGTSCSITITSSITVGVPAPSVTAGPITIVSNCGNAFASGRCPRTPAVLADPGIWESTILSASGGSSVYHGMLNLRDFATGRLLRCNTQSIGCALHVISIVCNSGTSATVYGTYTAGSGLVYFRMDVSDPSPPGQQPKGPYMFQDSSPYSVSVNNAINQVHCGP